MLTGIVCCRVTRQDEQDKESVQSNGLVKSLVFASHLPSNSSHSTPGYHIIITIALTVVASPPNASKTKSARLAELPTRATSNYLLCACLPFDLKALFFKKLIEMT